MLRVQGDGLSGDLLCLSHSATVVSESGEAVQLAEGMAVLAFEPDVDEDGDPEFLVASGRVVSSPPELQCLGSVWCLQIDEQGVRWVPELADA